MAVLEAKAVEIEPKMPSSPLRRSMTHRGLTQKLGAEDLFELVDVNNSGTICKSEFQMLYNLMNSSELHQQNERKTAQREARLFKRLALFFFLVVVVMIGANGGLVFGIVDATKETSNTDGTLTDKG